MFPQNHLIEDIDSEVPNHKKVEPNKKAQKSSTISNEGGGRVSILLVFNDDFRTGEHEVKDCGVQCGVCLERLHCDLQ